MAIKRVFLLQTEVGTPDPWDDSINLANVGIRPGLGLSNNASGFDNKIHFFQRVDNRFSISHSVYSESHLVLKRPYSTHDPSNEVPLNFDVIGKLLDDTTWKCHDGRAKVILLGSVINESDKSQQEAIAKAAFYVRDQEKIIDIITGDVYDNPKIIPWLFCYKTDDTPLYYIVLNPHSVQCINDIEGVYNENAVYTVSNHLKNLNEVIFKPKFSRNVRVIGEHNILVRGDSFTVDPFGTWFVKAHFPDFFKNAKVKVDTNFDYAWEDGKIKVNLLNKEKGYFIIRWNTGTGMDLIFHTSKNRFFRDYIIDVIK
jgi:hypothetical protein